MNLEVAISKNDRMKYGINKTIDLSNYKKGWLIKNELFIRCRNCQQEMFVKKYYQTKNNLYLCVDCFELLEANKK